MDQMHDNDSFAVSRSFQRIDEYVGRTSKRFFIRTSHATGTSCWRVAECVGCIPDAVSHPAGRIRIIQGNEFGLLA